MIPHAFEFFLTFLQILSNIQMNKLLHKPNCCPDWMYIIMQQCWRYNPKHRPPFIALLEHLTNRFVVRQQLLLFTLLTRLKKGKVLKNWQPKITISLHMPGFNFNFTNWQFTNQVYSSENIWFKMIYWMQVELAWVKRIFCSTCHDYCVSLIAWNLSISWPWVEKRRVF